MNTTPDCKNLDSDFINGIQFSDIFVLEDIQRLQDLFSDATGVASLITYPDGTPITRPSNFTKLCNNIIRKTGKGCANCFKSDAILGRHNPSGPVVQPCLSGGLWDAGASISVGGKHIANWLAGQVRNIEVDEQRIMQYADEIGANRADFMEALNEVPVMSVEQFNKVSKMLFVFAAELSERAFNNLQLKVQIIERDKVMALLKESEERFQLLFNEAPLGYQSLDIDGNLIDVNQQWLDTLGYSREEVIGKWFGDFLAPKYQEAFRGRFLVFKAQGNIHSEFEMVHKNGDSLFIAFEGKIAYDLNGKFKQTHCILQDLTGRKQAEEILQNERVLLHTLIDNIPDQIYYKDREGRFVLCNNAVVLNSDFNDASELIGKTDFDLFPDNASQYNNDEQQLMKSGVSLINLEEIIINRRTNEVKWNLSTKVPLKDSFGNTIGLIGINRDITERKHTEETLRESKDKLNTLFGSMTEMVALHELVFNEHGETVNYRITDCNKAFTEILGIKREDAIGKLATEVYQSELPSYLEEFSRVGITGEPYEYTTHFVPKDKYFMVSVVSPAKNHFATISTDVTAIQEIQEVIAAKNKELESYLYIASHDLRSPLVNIQGFSLRLQKQVDEIKAVLATCPLSPENKEAIDNITGEGIPKTLNFILSNVSKMDTLINGLLQVSRTGRMAVSISKVDMNKLCKSVIAAHNFQITEVSAKVIVDDLHDCYGDESQLNQLFSNIIGNAIKYRDKNRQLVIEIASQINYNKVIYSIKDTGIGIEQRYMEKIWDVFFRVDSGIPETGEGIGLSLAKRIADNHKGKIWAESEAGSGSIFYVELQKNEFSE
jgi:PAS domain S-box-containing protein